MTIEWIDGAPRMSETQTVSSPISLRARIGEKLPEIIIEAIFLTVAVLTAFAIDAWRLERQQQSDTAIAMASIRAELRENQASVKATLADIKSSLKAITPLIEQKPLAGSSFKVGFSLALLSTASWTMAQNNQSLTHVGSKQSTDLAKLYELQAWFNEAQRRALHVITELSLHDSSDWPGVRQHLLRAKLEFEFLSNTGEALLQEYALVLN
jgi:hypothetical protein